MIVSWEILKKSGLESNRISGLIYCVRIDQQIRSAFVCKNNYKWHFPNNVRETSKTTNYMRVGTHSTCHAEAFGQFSINSHITSALVYSHFFTKKLNWWKNRFWFIFIKNGSFMWYSVMKGLHLGRDSISQRFGLTPKRVTKTTFDFFMRIFRS